MTSFGCLFTCPNYKDELVGMYLSLCIYNMNPGSYKPSLRIEAGILAFIDIGGYILSLQIFTWRHFNTPDTRWALIPRSLKSRSSTETAIFPYRQEKAYRYLQIHYNINKNHIFSVSSVKGNEAREAINYKFLSTK